jgi:AcrR family transcriptional regulator
LTLIGKHCIINSTEWSVKGGVAKLGEQNARERILQAAIKVFAEKSFEGARVDEISREAKVPKSLIYYHFKSNDEILVSLLEFIDEYSLLLSKVPKETLQQKPIHARPYGRYYLFGHASQFSKIELMDSLKKTTQPPPSSTELDALLHRIVT